MRKLVFISCMALLTSMALGKASLSFFAPKPKEISVAERTQQQQDIEQAAPTSKAADWRAHWAVGELIPSAEAAGDITLDEESQQQGRFAPQLSSSETLQRLNAREKELNEREIAIQDAEKRALLKINELQALQKKIKAMLAEEDSIKDKKIKRLTTVYEGMKAERAAPVIAQMELDIVVKIFSRMNEKQVGKILSFLPPQKAVVISHALTKRLAALSP